MRERIVYMYRKKSKPPRWKIIWQFWRIFKDKGRLYRLWKKPTTTKQKSNSPENSVVCRKSGIYSFVERFNGTLHVVKSSYRSIDLAVAGCKCVRLSTSFYLFFHCHFVPINKVQFRYVNNCSILHKMFARYVVKSFVWAELMKVFRLVIFQLTIER